MRDEEEAVMTISEVAAYLRLAESTVYKLAQDGKLPGRKVGGTWRFSRRHLENWLKGDFLEGGGSLSGDA